MITVVKKKEHSLNLYARFRTGGWSDHIFWGALCLCMEYFLDKVKIQKNKWLYHTGLIAYNFICIQFFSEKHWEYPLFLWTFGCLVDQQAISELLLCYENRFDVHENELVGSTHFLINGLRKHLFWQRRLKNGLRWEVEHSYYIHKKHKNKCFPDFKNLWADWQPEYITEFPQRQVYTLLELIHCKM